MKKSFELKSFLTENKDQVINIYNEFAQKETFNGTSLKYYMLDVLENMQMNCPRSKKAAEALLSQIIYRCAYKMTDVQVLRDRDAEARNKYQGTAYMAIV